MKITAFSKCFEQLSRAKGIASIKSSEGVTSSQARETEKIDPYESRLSYLAC